MVKKNIQNLDDIIDVVKKLRDPKKGCPWDIQQNAKSLAKYTLEEAYEVVEAIESGNYNELEDEWELNINEYQLMMNNELIILFNLLKFRLIPI